MFCVYMYITKYALLVAAFENQTKKPTGIEEIVCGRNVEEDEADENEELEDDFHEAIDV